MEPAVIHPLLTQDRAEHAAILDQGQNCQGMQKGACLGSIMWVGELCVEVKTEVIRPLTLFVSKLDKVAPSLYYQILLQNGIDHLFFFSVLIVCLQQRQMLPWLK